ncbi:MAG TPA: circadian clock KaiB family protein [Bacteroidia bacterium]|nr:circadian clock KaiB family protein [Bacteroidia bacterium]
MKKQGELFEVGKKHKFILFVAGMSVKSVAAIENFGKICDKHLAGNFELEIIDVNNQKYQAAKYQIIALPTLIKLEPSPKRIIIGDMSDTNKVLQILNLI